MYVLLHSIAAFSVLIATSQATWACDGPQCQRSSRNTVDFPRPRLGSMAPQTACGCNICDPNRPCSPSSCALQGCQDCGSLCPTCPSDRFDGGAPLQSLPPTGISRRLSRSSLPGLTAQTVCPVTGEKLGSMGPPIPVQVKGRTVYVCCEGCVNSLRRNPEKYLSSRLPRDLGAKANFQQGRTLQ